MGMLTFAEMREFYMNIMDDEVKDFEWHAIWARNRFGIKMTADECMEFFSICHLSGAFDDL